MPRSCTYRNLSDPGTFAGFVFFIAVVGIRRGPKGDVTMTVTLSAPPIENGAAILLAAAEAEAPKLAAELSALKSERVAAALSGNHQRAVEIEETEAAIHRRQGHLDDEINEPVIGLRARANAEKRFQLWRDVQSARERLQESGAKWRAQVKRVTALEKELADAVALADQLQNDDGGFSVACAQLRRHEAQHSQIDTDAVAAAFNQGVPNHEAVHTF